MTWYRWRIWRIAYTQWWRITRTYDEHGVWRYLGFGLHWLGDPWPPASLGSFFEKMMARGLRPANLPIYLGGR